MPAKKQKSSLDDDYISIASSEDDDSVKEPSKKQNATAKKALPKPAPTKSSNTTAEEAKESSSPRNNDGSENDSYDIALPSLLGTANGGECTLMIEVDPDNAASLDYEGVSGAVGRFEADSHGISIDLKGNRYRGSILPGPTAMVVGLYKGGQLRVEGITDEFAALAKTKDVMASLDAVVVGEFGDGFKVRDEDVNKTKKVKQQEQPKKGTKSITGKRSAAAPAKSSNKKKNKAK
jgi:hypothetical protein